MDYMTTKEAAKLWNISDRRILQYCNEGRIADAEKVGHIWLIPKSTEKPADMRYKMNYSKDSTEDKQNG